VLFNHVLCFTREKSLLVGSLQEALEKITTLITDPTLTDQEALMGLLLCECRILFDNKALIDFVTTKLDA
jgi:hypothetical protein